MSRKRREGLLACALAGLMALAIEGCGGDSGNGNNAGAADAAPDVSRGVHREGGLVVPDSGGGQPEAATAQPFDGTARKALFGKRRLQWTRRQRPVLEQNLKDPLFPDAVCVDPSPCDLGDGTSVLFCDGADPTDPTLPGICLPSGTATTGIAGLCLPKCTIPSDGTAPVGCHGKDVCNAFAFGTDASGKVSGFGYCFGGCVADGDCPTGSKCQKDQGLCVATLMTATKSLGATCSANDTSGTTYGCNCLTNPKTQLGYCSQFCIVGQPSNCGAGFVCDAQLPTMLTGGTAGFTTQNAGLGGTCLQACGNAPVADAGSPTGGDASSDAAPEAGGTGTPAAMCPITANCTTTTPAGPVCVP